MLFVCLFASLFVCLFQGAKAKAEKGEKAEQKEQPMDIDKKTKLEPFSFPCGRILTSK